MQDGARNAFTGYLYQFLSVASLRAWAIVASDIDDELSSSLVARVQQGQLVHELHGQDAVVRTAGGGGGETVAIQFKYARTQGRMTIDRSELIDILQTFDRSLEEARIQGESLDRFVLVMNRSLDGNAQALYDKRAADALPELVLPERTPGGQEIARTKAVVKEYGSVLKAATAWHEVLRRLSIWAGLRFEAAVVRLRELATCHGLSAAEFDQARGRIISSILEATAHGPLEITGEWLTECIVDAPDALVLHLPSRLSVTTRTAAASELHRILTRFVRSEDTLVRRKLIDEASRKIRQFPLVWITGDGGCGKSVLAIQLLIQESSRRLTLVLSAKNATSGTCLSEALRRLRSARHFHRLPIDSTPELLDRMRTANAGVEWPLFLVDLDGLDEVSEGDRYGLRQLIDLFFARGQSGGTDAVLILTCRAPDRDKARAVETLVNHWFDTEVPDVIVGQIGAVHVGDFDDDELRHAVRTLDGEARRRIEETLATGAVPESTTRESGTFLPDSGGETTVPRELIESLRHPVMWGEFAGLPADDRVLALTGDQNVLRAVADRFLNRFSRKAIARRGTLRLEQVRAGVAAIGQAPPHDRVVRNRQTHWVRPALGPFNQDEAVYLYGEALSYGLILEEAPGHWRWRHPFVCNHLRMLEQ